MFEIILGYLRRHHIALLALFISLGGVSYAATQLPKNSVGAKQLKKNSVTAKKLKKNAVNSQKVKDGSLLARDFKKGQLPRGAAGPQGPAGPRGPVGAQGPPGPLNPGVPGKVVRHQMAGEFGFNETHTSFQSFPPNVVINAPTDGYVLATATTQLRSTISSIVGVCNAEVRLRHNGTTLSGSSGLGTFTPESDGNSYASQSVTDSFPVSAGPNTFAVVYRINPFVSPSCDGNFSIAAPTVNLLWVPEGEGNWPT